jgi:hypothetical protein
MIPSSVPEVLCSPVYQRAKPELVDAAFATLGVSPPPDLVAFYRRFCGPFSSETTGFELLDAVEGEPSVLTQTMVCRSVHGFVNQFLVLTDLLAGGVLVLGTTTSQVFDVDFEGGVERLHSGTLPPRWVTFSAFLQDYFRRADMP